MLRFLTRLNDEEALAQPSMLQRQEEMLLLSCTGKVTRDLSRWRLFLQIKGLAFRDITFNKNVLPR